MEVLGLDTYSVACFDLHLKMTENDNPTTADSRQAPEAADAVMAWLQDIDVLAQEYDVVAFGMATGALCRPAWNARVGYHPSGRGAPRSARLYSTTTVLFPLRRALGSAPSASGSAPAPLAGDHSHADGEVTAAEYYPELD